MSGVSSEKHVESPKVDRLVRVPTIDGCRGRRFQMVADVHDLVKIKGYGFRGWVLGDAYFF